MITFVAVSVLICCSLVILIGVALSSQLSEIGDNVTRIKEIVREMNGELPYNSWFMSTYKDLNKKLDDINDHLTTEIACLATKNNEDIMRMKGDFQQWDMIKFDGEQWIIYRIDKNVNGDTFYRVHNAKGQITNVSSKDIQNATFVKHTGSQFDEQK